MFSGVVRSLNFKKLIIKHCHRQFNSISMGVQHLEDFKNGQIFHNKRRFSSVIPKTPTTRPLISQETLDDFMAMFPTVLQHFTENDEEYSDSPQLKAHFVKMMTYTVPKGKNYRGLSAVGTYKLVEKEENLTPENIHFANCIGWVIEVNEAFIIVVDDIMDQTDMRREAPCWYMVANNGSKCLNDGLMLQNQAYALLKAWFSKHPAYFDLLHLIQDCTMKTTIGQIVETLSKKEGVLDLDALRMENYLAITVYKTAYCVFYLPLVAGLYLANIKDEKLFQQIVPITNLLGYFVQLENDYHDVYGYINTRGYMGNDIRQGKLTWLAVTTLQKATPAQRKLMAEHYAKDDKDSEKIILDLYEEVGIQEEFKKVKEETFGKIRRMVNNLENDVVKEPIIAQAESVYLNLKY